MNTDDQRYREIAAVQDEMELLSEKMRHQEFEYRQARSFSSFSDTVFRGILAAFIGYAVFALLFYLMGRGMLPLSFLGKLYRFLYKACSAVVRGGRFYAYAFYGCAIALLIGSALGALTQMREVQRIGQVYRGMKAKRDHSLRKWNAYPEAERADFLECEKMEEALHPRSADELRRADALSRDIKGRKRRNRTGTVARYLQRISEGDQMEALEALQSALVDRDLSETGKMRIQRVYDQYWK